MSDYERTLLTRLLEVHDLQRKNLANDYESVRTIRRQGNAVFEEVREYLNRPPAKQPAPVNILLEQANVPKRRGRPPRAASQ